MPFTPFHMGPAAAFKLVGLSGFSFAVFGYSQILIDLEPLVRLIRNDDVLHGHSHTYVGAILIGLFVTLTGKRVYEIGASLWNGALAVWWLQLDESVSRPVVFVSALLGTTSHVLLDSLMHSDMRPLFPFSDENHVLGAITGSQLHLICLGMGVIGGAGLCIAWVWRRLRDLRNERTGAAAESPAEENQ